MDKPLDDDETLNLRAEKMEDHMFLRNKGKTSIAHKKKELEIESEHRKRSGHFCVSTTSRMSLSNKGTVVNIENYSDMLLDSFDKIHPMLYLNTEQRKKIMECITMLKFDQKVVLYSGSEMDYDNGDNACFILLEGEIHVFNNRNVFQDIINSISFFGYDGPIFQKRFSTVLVEKNSLIGFIQQKDFLELLTPFSKFATFISRNIRYKDKVLDDLQNFKSYILSCIDKGPIDIKLLIELYKGINSCMHPKCNSEDIDITAWAYALNRLPEGIFGTYIFVLINKPPKLLFLSEELAEDLIPRLETQARNRDIYKYLDGKNLVLVREMETDVMDFVSNMCIHIIESTKLRKLIASPLTVNRVFQVRHNFEETLEVLMSTTGIFIGFAESVILKKVFGNTLGDKLISLCLHYQDFSITLNKEILHDKDPVENWVQNLWNVTRSLIGVKASVDEIEDLVVDIIQGSKKTLLASISPHLYLHKQEIYDWAEKMNIKLKTKDFFNENDKLIAYSYYYYVAHPEKNKERKEMNKLHGIEVIEQTFGTGVQIIVVNANKLHSDFIDPNLKLSPVSKNHIIINLGYTFGAQSHQIIKPVLMLFGSKARSLNILGKCGGLIGERTDIIVADKIFYDKTHDLCEVNYGNMDFDDLRKCTRSKVHVGPILTVAGTILQNSDLLYFYKHVMGCVGLEMEGYYFAREIENCIKHKLVRSDFVSRLFYYSSDLPLDPLQNLTKEESNVSWDEGIGCMNAIQRFILKQILGGST